MGEGVIYIGYIHIADLCMENIYDRPSSFELTRVLIFFEKVREDFSQSHLFQVARSLTFVTSRPWHIHSNTPAHPHQHTRTHAPTHTHMKCTERHAGQFQYLQCGCSDKGCKHVRLFIAIAIKQVTYNNDIYHIYTCHLFLIFRNFNGKHDDMLTSLFELEALEKDTNKRRKTIFGRH